MLIVTYYKMGSSWFLDHPEYLENGGDIEDLERIGGFHDFLELVAQGGSTVNIQIDDELFDGADIANFTGTSGDQSGAYYHISTFQHQPINIEVWVNNMIYMNQEKLPEKIYFRVL